MRVEDARVAARKALAAPTSREVVKCLEEGIGDAIDWRSSADGPTGCRRRGRSASRAPEARRPAGACAPPDSPAIRGSFRPVESAYFSNQGDP
jgi:hypothetical protein